MLFWFGWMGGLLEVRVPEWGDADESGTILPTTLTTCLAPRYPRQPPHSALLRFLCRRASVVRFNRRYAKESVPQKMADESKSSPTVDMGNFTTAAQPEPLTGIN
ncbi:hypothetical protein BGY98DRAFT_936629 [Russula aff. rugulosa BPL654]|nr:hypothetical protein BGY98DRAFT_936629 [Russula aff. rugulosa BPL654]